MRPRRNVIAAVLLAWAAVIAGFGSYIVLTSPPGGVFLPAFGSEGDLREYLSSVGERSGSYSAPFLRAPMSPGADFSLGGAEGYFSTTNVQVQGIDEEDVVKTDGEFLYLASGTNVTIVKAYPPEQLAIIARIEASQLLGGDVADLQVYITGLFLALDKLVVIGNAYVPMIYSPLEPDRLAAPEVLAADMPRTMVSIFDVTDPASPDFLSSFSISGYSLTSRMVEGVVYVVTQHYIWYYEDDYLLPQTWEGTEPVAIDATSIRYDPASNTAGSYVNLLAVDVNALESDFLSLVAGYASTIYMAPGALYLTFQKWTGDVTILADEVAPEDTNTAITTIYKIRVAGLAMEAVAKGDVTGWLLNQFSMDEQAPYLRVATTTDWTTPNNAVYVLDADLKVVGALTGLAPTERIFSARFVGNTLYLVTFLQIDPLFVIDLSDPQAPRVLGELVMPGFSAYLHPVDETHVLGIGRENSSVKISLYDVSDPAHPTELDKYIVPGDYSDSLAIWEHKAVLFDSEKQLLVLPISWYDDTGGYSWTTWGGFFVFTVSVQDGIALRGTVAHDFSSLRSLYIGDYLYTVSSAVVKVNSLTDLSEIGSLKYQPTSWYIYKQA